MLGYLILAVFIAAAIAYVAYPPFREKVKGWRTVGTAAFVAALGFLEQFDLTTVVAKDQVGYWLLGIGIAMAVLRAVTSGSIGKA